MNWLLIALGTVGVLVLLLLARGMYLIGTGSEAEMEARREMSGSVSNSGWMTLDALRSGDLPVVSTVEEKLGLNDEDEEE